MSVYVCVCVFVYYAYACVYVCTCVCVCRWGGFEYLLRRRVALATNYCSRHHRGCWAVLGALNRTRWARFTSILLILSLSLSLARSLSLSLHLSQLTHLYRGRCNRLAMAWAGAGGGSKAVAASCPNAVGRVELVLGDGVLGTDGDGAGQALHELWQQRCPATMILSQCQIYLECGFRFGVHL